jgi:hypothetical protein
MKHWMFSCSEVSQKVSQSMETPLPFLNLVGIRIHLLMCRYCLRFGRQLKLLRKMSRYDESGTLPPELPNQLSKDARERIKDSLRTQP